MGYAHQSIVHRVHESIQGVTARTHYDVVRDRPGFEGNLTTHKVVERNILIGHTQTPYGFTAFGAESLFLLIAQVTIIVIVAELRILPRCFTAFPHLIGGREILIDIPALNELLKNLLVNVLTFTLRLTIRFMRAAYAHAFVPVNAQPVQTVEHLVERFFRISCRIGILNTENELTAGMARISPVKQGCTYHAHVRGSGR